MVWNCWVIGGSGVVGARRMMRVRGSSCCDDAPAPAEALSSAGAVVSKPFCRRSVGRYPGYPELVLPNPAKRPS
ncbi:hypothetical protein I553_4343 [Mycobacterium xenopi 4042]|uniref:Uncharacterized protein n=1 Tax=Mycobacterium xenopi 4042 TaxID=1299334 RepID=X8ADR9_MYCXE|nr:hypothetical protein I553_4343 [Mycobacterium xenopi 4042]